MGKIILIVVIIGVGYSWQKGGLREWFKESTTFQREEASAPASTRAQQSGNDPAPDHRPQIQAQPMPARPDFGQPGRASGPASECAQVRANVQVMESWMRSGGRVVDVDAKKKLSENDTFSELARHRQYLADNCGGR